MTTIKEKAKEAERNTHPLFESFRESDGKPVSVYVQDDMISMFEQGANYVLECFESILPFVAKKGIIYGKIKETIEQLKK